MSFDTGALRRGAACRLKMLYAALRFAWPSRLAAGAGFPGAVLPLVCIARVA